MCDMAHSYVCHDSFICVTELIHMYDKTHSVCDMTHSYMWHDSFICVTWLSPDLSTCVTGLIHMCDMSHSYVWHDSFLRMTWLHMCGMTQSCFWHDWVMTYSHVRHDSFVCVTWLIQMIDMTHSFVWHGWFSDMTWPVHNVTWLIHTSAMKHSYMYHDSPYIHICTMTHTFIHVPWLTIHSYMCHESPYIHMCDVTYTHTCDMTHRGSFPWYRPRRAIRIHACDKTHSYAWHDSCMYVAWHIHIRNMTQYLFIRVTWLTLIHVTCRISNMCHDSFHTCHMTDSAQNTLCSCVWHDSCSYMWHVASHTCDMTQFIHVTWLIARRSFIGVTWLMLIHVTWLISYMSRFCNMWRDSNMSHHTCDTTDW